MKMETLCYIKKLLEEEVKNRKECYEYIDDFLRKKEDESGVQWNTPDNKVNESVKRFRNLRQVRRDALSKAKDALEDFMEHDWR